MGVLLLAFLFATDLASSDFLLKTSASGVVSLKRPHDVYDTDYISPGRALGELHIRYRPQGETAWKALGPAVATGSGSFAVGAPVPTVAGSSRVSASAPAARTSLAVLNDGETPADASDDYAERYVWPRRGGAEWVQYDFPAARTVHNAEAFWVADGRAKFPKSWRLLYQDGVSWKPIEAAYPLSTVGGSRVEFTPVTTTALRLEVQLDENASAGLYEWRVDAPEGPTVRSADDLIPSETFRLDGPDLVWTIDLKNVSSKALEIGDLGVLLPFNTQYGNRRDDTYTKRLIRHSFVGEDGSFVFWARTNGVPPFLAMVPEPGTRFEYNDVGAGRSYTPYIHAAATLAEVRARGGKWALPGTSLVLPPKGSKRYAFRFRFAKDYDGVRDALVAMRGVDVHVAPGMTIPTDQTVTLGLRSETRIKAVRAQYPGQTKVTASGAGGKGARLYKVRFARLGENTLTVEFDKGRRMPLPFFATEPIETLIKKRAAFLVSHEQHKDPSKWYLGLYSEWDMKNEVLRGPDDRDTLSAYMVASDDPILGRGAYLATKNVYYPDHGEIDSLEFYIRNHVWGGLQQTTEEPFPYAIYGIDNWKQLRSSPNDDRTGRRHIWRIYDYPHIVSLYTSMARVARDHPEMVHLLDAKGYLTRAWGTAMAFFEVPLKVEGWSAYDTGTYNEVVIPGLIRDLETAGMVREADGLRAHWERKATTFINDKPNLFGSEYAFDSTGFESTQALAHYAMDRLSNASFRAKVSPEAAREFLELQVRLNFGDRGFLEPTYYTMGSDYRAGLGTSYVLSYMSQMGGWGLQDYGLHLAKDPAPYLRLGAASLLSSWALMNTGTPESHYGYWFPGKENDGGAGGGFESRPLARAWLGNKEIPWGSWWYSGEIDLGFNGALRGMATIVTEDPIFGTLAYNGDLVRKGESWSVVPKDGLRARFHVVRGERRIGIELARDGFAAGRPITFDEALKTVSFEIENRSGDAHAARLTISGPYEATVGGKAVTEIPIAATGTTRVTLRKVG